MGGLADLLEPEDMKELLLSEGEAALESVFDSCENGTCKAGFVSG